MKSKKDIYSVPEGYFDSLEMRLSLIPGKETPAARPLWRPAFMIPALAGVALLLAVALFFRPLGQHEDSLALVEDFYASDLIPHTNPYLLYDDSALSNDSAAEDALEVSDEDVAYYLIDDGVTVDMIEQIIY